MQEAPRSLHHDDESSTTDEGRRQEARTHLAASGPLQFVAELLGKLRAIRVPWWTPERTRDTWSALERMNWYVQRPDLRQKIVTNLTGLPARTARNKTPEYQADLLVSVMEAGDLSAARFEEAFDPRDLVVYGPAADFWHRFRERMPWEDASPVHQELVAWTLRALLSSGASFDGMSRNGIITPWDLRASIDAHVWQQYMPLEIRAAVDEARLRQEKARPRDLFATRNELGIATPERIAAHIPLVELIPVFATAERALGFGTGGARPELETEEPAAEADAQPPAGTSKATARSAITLRRLVAA